MTTTAAIIAAGEARAALVATLPRTQLIRGVDMTEFDAENDDRELFGEEFLEEDMPVPAKLVQKALVEALEAMRDDPIIKAVCNSQLWAKMVDALKLAKGEKP